ncbi:methyltransferase family protein [Sphingomonas sp. PB1R3]|uniref:methyltransferase family protein n=1 Tax=Sphingomonas flavida TaxID=3096154 RepID=UPI002FCC1AEE
MAVPLSPPVRPPRPASAVSHGVGLVGIIGSLGWIAFARWRHLDGPYASLVHLLCAGVPMLLWSILVDRVHRHDSTGIDWAHPRPLRETLDISLTKLAGYWATFAGIALIFATGRFYWQGIFAFAMWCLGWIAPVLFLLSIPYVIWLDRRLVEPKDGAWMLGAWLTGQPGVDRQAIFAHLRSWAVKAFFLPFMLGVVPGGFAMFVRGDLSVVLRDPVALANWLITLMFLIDVAFATIGYMLTMRPLDAHIRSANPYAAGWAAALICYPPTILMGDNGPLNYRPGTAEWSYWFAGHPIILAAIGAMLVLLTAIYAWSTVAFGIRFSNLTHRGILTHGPYAVSRHPAYLSKNLFWWIATIPILSTGTWVDAARSTLLLGVVSGIYYWRARTEERHLSADPAYREYDDWMARYGLVPRFFRWVLGRG